MGFEEAGREEERLITDAYVVDPPGGTFDDVVATRVGYVDRVEAEAVGVGALVLHTEQHRPVTVLGQQRRQRPHPRPVGEPVMGEPDQAVAVGVLPGEQRSAGG